MDVANGKSNNSSMFPETANNVFGWQPPATYLIVQAVVLSVIVLVTVLGNVAVCYVVWRTHSITTVAGISITSLATADMLRGVLVTPFIVTSSAMLGFWNFGPAFCRVVGFLHTLFSSASVMTLGVVSIDRYMAIVHPLKYAQTVTLGRAVIFLGLSWLTSLINALTPLIGWSTYVYVTSACTCVPNPEGNLSYTYFYITTSYFLPFSILVVCYYKIFKIARNQSRRVNNIELPSMSHTITRVTRINVVGTGGKRVSKLNDKIRNSMRREKKAAMTLFFVMGIFILCVSPYCICFVYLGHHSSQVGVLAFSISSILSFANCAANPLIYGILNRKFRQCFMQVIKCRCCCGKRQQLTNTLAKDFVSCDARTGITRRGRLVPRDLDYVTTVPSEYRDHTTVQLAAGLKDTFNVSVTATSGVFTSLGSSMKESIRSTLPPIEDVT